MSGSKPRVSRGSMLSDKQIAFAVKNERRLTFYLGGGLPAISGYVFGVDDYHWAVVTYEGGTHLIHKSAPLIVLEKASLGISPEADAVRLITEPFRKNLLGHDTATPAEG